MKRSTLSILLLLLFHSVALAAGGEINACIRQESKMRNTSLAGIAHNIAIKNPFGDDFEIKTGRASVNSINNKGKMNGFIFQKSDLYNTEVISSQINTIENKGKIDGYVEQQNEIKNSRIIGAEVNTLTNKGNVGNVIQKGRLTHTNIITN